MCIYAYSYTYITTIKGKEALNLRESKTGYMGSVGGKKGKGENDIYNYINLKNYKKVKVM